MSSRPEFARNATINQMVPNPETGFLESNNPATAEAFDSIKKTLFLELARKYAELRQLPDLTAICKHVGVSIRTFERHLHYDEVFAQAWTEIKKQIYFGLANELSIKANTKGGIVANLAALKYLERGKFAEDEIILSTNMSPIKGLISGSNGVIDGELVDNE